LGRVHGFPRSAPLRFGRIRVAGPTRADLGPGSGHSRTGGARRSDRIRRDSTLRFPILIFALAHFKATSVVSCDASRADFSGCSRMRLVREFPEQATREKWIREG